MRRLKVKLQREASSPSIVRRLRRVPRYARKFLMAFVKQDLEFPRVSRRATYYFS